jgi:hypothetical protein
VCCIGFAKSVGEFLHICNLCYRVGIPIVGMSALVRYTQALEKVVDTAFVVDIISPLKVEAHPRSGSGIPVQSMVGWAARQNRVQKRLLLFFGQSS